MGNCIKISALLIDDKFHSLKQELELPANETEKYSDVGFKTIPGSENEIKLASSKVESRASLLFEITQENQEDTPKLPKRKAIAKPHGPR